MTAQEGLVSEWLGTESKSDLDLARIVRRGLPLKTQDSLVSHGMTKDEFYLIVIPQRTFRHRTERLNKGLGDLLTADESDKALRAARVLALSERVFGQRDKALSWMRTSKKRFQGETPMEMLRTEAGARLVEQMLIQIDEGMFA